MAGGKHKPSDFFPILNEDQHPTQMTDEEIAARMRLFFGPTDHERQQAETKNGTR